MVNQQKPSLVATGCCFHYQIQVTLDPNGIPQLVGAEMLVRGDATVTDYEGNVFVYKLPGEILAFIKKLCTEKSLLRHWTKWTLNEAADALLATTGSGIRLSLNVDPRQLLVDGFYSSVESLVPVTERDRFTLELTEPWPIPETESVASCLNAIDALGIHISIDDFCTIPDENADVGEGLSLENTQSPPRAHSHVYYLANKPVSEVKVDMSCAKEIIKNAGSSTEKLVNWIATLPTFFNGIHVVIEGVAENFPGQLLGQYKGNSKVWFQGYGFSSPKPLSDLKNFIQSPATVNWSGNTPIA